MEAKTFWLGVIICGSIPPRALPPAHVHDTRSLTVRPQTNQTRNFARYNNTGSRARELALMVRFDLDAWIEKVKRCEHLEER